MTWQLIQKRETKCEAAVFPNLISKASCHHFCHILLITQTILATVCWGLGVGGPHRSVTARRWESWPPHPPRTTLFHLVSQSYMPVDSFPTPANSVPIPRPASPDPFTPLCHPQTRASREALLLLLSPLCRPWSSWGAVSRAVLCCVRMG